jgi:hypothetical protein
MVKCCVFFAVRAEYLNNIYTSFGFKGLYTVLLILLCDILEIRVENIADIIVNCLCVNRVNISVADSLNYK